MMLSNELQHGGKLEVVVTPAHVADGEQGDCRRCPVALALQAATGDPAATVKGFQAAARGAQLRLDLASVKAMRDYDLTGAMAPRRCTFTVSVWTC